MLWDKIPNQYKSRQHTNTKKYNKTRQASTILTLNTASFFDGKLEMEIPSFHLC